MALGKYRFQMQIVGTQQEPAQVLRRDGADEIRQIAAGRTVSQEDVHAEGNSLQRFFDSGAFMVRPNSGSGIGLQPGAAYRPPASTTRRPSYEPPIPARTPSMTAMSPSRMDWVYTSIIRQFLRTKSQGMIPWAASILRFNKSLYAEAVSNSPLFANYRYSYCTIPAAGKPKYLAEKHLLYDKFI